jgi:SAM-dependent methyltransferase
MITAISTALSSTLSDERKDWLKGLLRRIGVEHEDWARIVEYQKCFEFVRSLGPEKLEALEISGGGRWKQLGFKRFFATDYPAYDVCERAFDRQFDIIIADQVFEHLLYPNRAGRHVFEMLKPGGWFVMATPFLIKLHPMPYDCTRWTPTGMKYFLSECGFELEKIQTDAWGNRACVEANLGKHWAKFAPWRSLKNDKSLPVNVWGFAQK